MKIMASDPITSWQTDGETMEMVKRFIILGSKSLRMVTAAMKLKDAWKKSCDKSRQSIKKQSHYSAYKSPYSESYSHVCMWDLDHKEG